jgi:ribonucleoside-diphosphate reductase beta chain
MSKINEGRVAFKPFQYQWAYDYWFKQQNAHWLHTEINMQNDVADWREHLNEEEKNVIGNILKGFTQTECEVGDYWSSYVPKWFPVPEIKMMAQTFGAFETIHANAYSYLNDTLGLDNFEAFLEDEATMAKLKVLMDVDPDTTDLTEIARSIALFSAAAEGIQLFSSFAVLLSFRKSNRLTGIGQQMIFSVKDESTHSEAGCKIFRTIIEENPELWTEELRKSVYDGIHYAIQSEFTYINKIFELGDLETITKEQLKNFMYDRANRKLVELNLKPIYNVNKQLLNEMEWFYILVSGEQQTDFFANRETGYSKPNEDWNDSDLF